MLFQKKRAMPWPIFLFGILAAGIVAATGWILVTLVSRVSRAQTPVAVSQGDVSTTGSVLADYKRDIDTLLHSIENPNEAPSMALSRVENTLVAMRVPYGMLDAHVAAVIQVKKQDAAGDVRRTLAEIVGALRDRSHTLSYE